MLEEEVTSWVRRAKFAHTVCHRLDGSSLANVSLERTKPASVNPRPGPDVVYVQKHPSKNMPRAVSPHPELKISDTFKEARSTQKRFSTPNPRRNENNKGIEGKLYHKDTSETMSPKSQRHRSPLRHFSSMKFNKRSRSRKESTWTKYFDHHGGRVNSIDAMDENMIDLSNLMIGLRFAHGAHSQLYHGIYKDEPVAVKIIRVPDDDENGALSARLEKQFTREVTLLSRLHHQNIIKLIGAFRKPLVFCIVTEYLTEGSLRSYLHKPENKPLPLQKLISMALDIARGMEYIHSQCIIHRDLKPENILVSKDFCLKVADFGIACEEVQCDLLADDPGSYRWMAPEMIRRKHYGKKVDVYGFGLILYEFITGSVPYEDMTPIQAAFAVLNKDLRPCIPRKCPSVMRDLIEQCWSSQADKRPDFCQIVKLLEQLELSLARDGSLNLVQNSINHEHKKGLMNWINKLGTHHQTTSMPKPKFT